jgi:hypothetical protein
MHGHKQKRPLEDHLLVLEQLQMHLIISRVSYVNFVGFWHFH